LFGFNSDMSHILLRCIRREASSVCADSEPEVIEARAEYTLDTAEIIGKIHEDTDEESLAGVKLQLVEISEETFKKLGQVGQNPPYVTRRRYFVTIENHEGIPCVFETGCHSSAMTERIFGGR